MADDFERRLAEALKREARGHHLALSSNDVRERLVRSGHTNWSQKTLALMRVVSGAAIAIVGISVLVGLTTLRGLGPLGGAPNATENGASAGGSHVASATMELRPSPIVCAAARMEGILVSDGQGNLALEPGDGQSFRIIWPEGLAVRQAGSILQLLDDQGNVIASEGDVVILSGGRAANGDWISCGRPQITE